jgi:D-alanyl-D-alanine carboxypeptidase (penicillin-binding protein 5/6)
LRGSRLWLAAPALAAVLAAALAANYLRPVPPVAATQTIAGNLPGGSPPALPWPGQGQAAVGAEGVGVLADTPGARPLPTASVAKVMTALLTVEAMPLQVGQQGPQIVVTPADVATYEQDKAEGGSVIMVKAGERLTEYQLLEGLLIPSGNNAAMLLARWVAGSTEAFVERMNARARQLGMAQTTFTDPSGFSPDTVSVPADLVRLGEVAMRQPVIAQVVGQASATLPVAGIVYNVNYVVGQDGIVGVKTGSSPQARAVYLSAGAETLPDGRRMLVFGAVQGLPTLEAAFAASRTLLDFVRARLTSRRLVARGQVVGRFQAPWGSASELVATEDLEVLVWPGTALRTRLDVRPVRAPVAAGAPVGSLRVTSGAQNYALVVSARQGLPAPGKRWRLTRLP